ncbi:MULTISPECIES: EamA family transporter [unclassified Paenibacillus]|uniref:EamA family transporter n=2 Tax=unclassified Paenibacillus TaxID=185978 RepID=UPI00384D00E0
MYANQTWSYKAWLGLLMGIFSFMANTFLYKGYAVGRASVIAFFSGLTPMLVVLLAALLWQKTLTLVQLVGFCIIILSLIVVRYQRDLQVDSIKAGNGAYWPSCFIASQTFPQNKLYFTEYLFFLF